MNLSNEIPKRAYINAEIISSVVKTEDWSKSVSSIIKKYKLKDYQFQGPSYILSLLYCLFVVPKELWIKKDKTLAIFSQINVKNIESKINITIPNDFKFVNNDSIYTFIEKFRHAIAHANYKIDENMNFTFWNYPLSDRNNKDFEFEVTAENLMYIVSEVGSKLANIQNNSI